MLSSGIAQKQILSEINPHPDPQTLQQPGFKPELINNSDQNPCAKKTNQPVRRYGFRIPLHGYRAIILTEEHISNKRANFHA